MDILEQLKQERAHMRSHAMGAPREPERHGPEGTQAVQRAMESLYARLERLAGGLRELDPNVGARYEVPQVGTLADLRQGDYAVETYDPVAPRFAFTFNCIGERPLTRAAPSVEQKNLIREQVENLDLTVHIDDMSTWHYIVSVKPLVPVRLVFEPSPDGEEIRMTAHNLEALGRKLYSLHPEVIGEELCNEIGKLVLRRANRFAEFAGNHVSEDIRRRLQDRVKARQASRERVARDLRTESASRGARFKKLLGLRGVETSAPSGRAAASVRDLDQGLDPARGEHDGFIDWEGERESPDRAAAEQAHGVPVPAAVAGEPKAPPAYAWMITGEMDGEDSSASVGRHGPHGSARRFTTSQMLTDGERFRLVDRHGGVRFHGMIVGKYRGVEPLLDFGLDRECYLIQYFRDGAWVRVRAKD